MPVSLGRLTKDEWGWIGPFSVAFLAFVLRIINLGSPRSLTFDETYYAKDAWGLIHGGYARDAVEDANTRIITGDTNVFTKDPTWVVHPDGGKWLIAAGEHVFGLTPFGWRIAAVIVGSLTVLVLARLILRLTNSVVIACLGGLMMALDGVAFTMSRIALLDIFLTFWIVCGVACLAADRDWLTEKLKVSDRYLVWRPWQLAAGACFGMAMGTKWSGLYVLAAFGVTVVLWEIWTRGRVASVGDAVARVFRVGIPAFGWLVIVGLVVYILTWTGFLLHHQVFEARFGHGYGDEPVWGAYVDTPTGGPFGGMIDAFRSLWHYHVMTYNFHTGDYLADKTHPYQSNPIGWLVQWRPINVASNFDIDGSVCGAREGTKCVSEILVVGNPAVWWTGTVTLVVALVAWIRHPTWRWSLPLVGVASTWLPWFFVGTRPIFNFYAITILPFIIVALCLVIAGARRHVSERVWWIGVGLYTVLLVGMFVYFYPIWSNMVIPYDSWKSRMWFDRWI